MTSCSVSTDKANPPSFQPQQRLQDFSLLLQSSASNEQNTLT
ncbi:hypothetical protein [Nostoc sphaeroides]|nr:hypothetical protein [Nostoc sphaeroides]